MSVAMGTGPNTTRPASWKALQKRILCGSLGIFCTYRNVRLLRVCGRSLLNGEGAVSRPAALAAILPGLLTLAGELPSSREGDRNLLV
jgi:hypothetical protein